MQRNHTRSVLEVMPREAAIRATKSRGFTLIELMITIMIMAVLMMVAAPSFIAFQRNSELTTTANSFLAAMAAARAEAMKRGMKAYVMPTNADNVTWTTGWRVFVDTNWDGTYQQGTDILILEQEAVPASISVTTATVSFSRGGTATSAYAGFNGSGYPALIGTATGTPAGGIEFQATGGENRRVLLNQTGRMRVCKSSDTACS